MIGVFPSASPRVLTSPVSFMPTPPETDLKTRSHSILSSSAIPPAQGTALPLHNAVSYADHKKLLRQPSPAIHPLEYAPAGADSRDALLLPVSLCSFFFILFSSKMLQGLLLSSFQRKCLTSNTAHVSDCKKSGILSSLPSVMPPHKQHTFNPMD